MGQFVNKELLKLNCKLSIMKTCGGAEVVEPKFTRILYPKYSSLREWNNLYSELMIRQKITILDGLKLYQGLL